MPWVPGERPKPKQLTGAQYNEWKGIVRKCNGCGVEYNVKKMRSHKCTVPIQDRSPEGKRWYASLKKHKKAANARYREKVAQMKVKRPSETAKKQITKAA